ncbi:MAG: DUF4143 domain-containing protein [Proteiniphilum sp.]|nr:DUF4143 domain-containing protein [Proteiniphilum sp.]
MRKRGSSPKFQVYNNVLITSQSDGSYEQAIISPKYWGRLVESSVGTHLLNHALSEKYSLYYWRDGNQEVDFVLEKCGFALMYWEKSVFLSDYIGRKMFNNFIKAGKYVSYKGE